jgi:hypothetical protein
VLDAFLVLRTAAAAGNLSGAGADAALSMRSPSTRALMIDERRAGSLPRSSSNSCPSARFRRAAPW